MESSNLSSALESTSSIGSETIQFLFEEEEDIAESELINKLKSISLYDLIREPEHGEVDAFTLKDLKQRFQKRKTELPYLIVCLVFLMSVCKYPISNKNDLVIQYLKPSRRQKKILSFQDLRDRELVTFSSMSLFSTSSSEEPQLFYFMEPTPLLQNAVLDSTSCKQFVKKELGFHLEDLLPPVQRTNTGMDFEKATAYSLVTRAWIYKEHKQIKDDVMRIPFFYLVPECGKHWASYEVTIEPRAFFLKDKFPEDDVERIFKKNASQIYVNAEKANYADVLIWNLESNGIYQLFGIQCKDYGKTQSEKCTASPIVEECEKVIQNPKLDSAKYKNVLLLFSKNSLRGFETVNEIKGSPAKTKQNKASIQQHLDAHLLLPVHHLLHEAWTKE